MKFIKPILLIVLLFAFSAAGLYIQKKSNLLSQKFGQIKGVQKWVEQKSGQLQPLTQDAQKQIEVLGERTKEVSEQSKQVLGETVKVNEELTNDNRPVHEKAFDYGRYVYCKQVVQDFEKEDSQKSTN